MSYGENIFVRLASFKHKFSAAGHEFNVNESKIYNIQKKEEEICLSVCKAKLLQKVRR